MRQIAEREKLLIVKSTLIQAITLRIFHAPYNKPTAGTPPVVLLFGRRNL
jgi:hypothetical protein